MKHSRTLHGQGLAEYALLLALLVIGVILILQLTGTSLSDVYCRIGSAITGENTCQASENAVCVDDFSANTNNWIKAQGAWKMGDGNACASGVGMVFDKCSTNLNLTDYTVKLTDVNLAKGDGYGVFFRSNIDSKGNFNGYTFQYDPGYRAFIFRKWVNGKELPPFAVAPAKDYNWYGSPKDVSIKVQGDQFTAYIDNVPVLTGKDGSFTEGGAGLRSWDSSQVCLGGFSILK
jgi:Flp pilus assembly pilin Flp